MATAVVVLAARRTHHLEKRMMVSMMRSANITPRRSPCTLLSSSSSPRVLDEVSASSSRRRRQLIFNGGDGRVVLLSNNNISFSTSSSSSAWNRRRPAGTFDVRLGGASMLIPQRRTVSTLVSNNASSSICSSSTVTTTNGGGLFVKNDVVNNKNIDHLFNPTISAATRRIQHQQVRWKGRNDGARFHGKQRPPTKKQRKKYHRQLQRQQEAANKHGKPGSKAGLRREWMAMEKQDILNENNSKDENEKLLSENDNDEYGQDDALFDDLMGNVKEAIPAPEPVYLGHKQRKYYNRVVDQMDDYRKYQQQQKEEEEEGVSTTTTTQPAVPVVELPSDRDISLALRAFRDKNGTRQRPVGIIAALQHVLQDLQVPLTALDERSYTTLLLCCRTVLEARRVFKLMREHQVPISPYSWSILCDIHAKLGDYKGCVAVQEEMLKEEKTGSSSSGTAPTLASYTSLLAACYKVCMDGRIAHSIRAEAARVGWEKWQEMRVVGVDPDVMAYGAILRLQAARGQAEKAINILEEMPRMGNVKPTTLCFSAALRAVARSHAIAIRYEKGSSRRNRRREYLTSHHGKMARSILILAESAGADQDDGFIAALCLCAAEAGDVATAKAIYTASQIRRLDQFRTIGPDSHLARLRGEDVQPEDESTIDLLPAAEQQQEQLPYSSGSTKFGGDDAHQQQQLQASAEDGMPSPVSEEEEVRSPTTTTTNARRKKKRNYPSFGEREYGKDNRILSAILHACAQSVNQNGIGTMWQGRENKGYLCINSLRLIAQPRLPQYSDDTIPGQQMTDTLTWAGEHRDEDDYREGKRKSRKFAGVDVDEEAGSTMDELDESFAREFLEEDGRRKEEYRRSTPQDIWRMKYGYEDLEREQRERLDLQAGGSTTTTTTSPSELVSGTTSEADYEEVEHHVESSEAEEDPRNAQLEAEYKAMLESLPDDVQTSETVGYEYDATLGTTRSLKSEDEYAKRVKAHEKPSEQTDGAGNKESEEGGEEMVFDTDLMRWTTKPKEAPQRKQLKDSATETTLATAVTSSSNQSDGGGEEEMYFDTDDMRWKTRPRVDTEKPTLTSYEAQALAKTKTTTVSESKMETKMDGEKQLDDQKMEESTPEIDEEAFANFFKELRQEALESGEGDVSEEEGREIFVMMKDEYNEMIGMSPEELGLDGFPMEEGVSSKDTESLSLNEENVSTQASKIEASGGKDLNDIVDELKSEWRGQGSDLGDGESSDKRAAQTTVARNVQTAASRSDAPPFHTSKVMDATAKDQTVITYDNTYEEPAVHQETENMVAEAPSTKSFLAGTFTESVEVMDADEVEQTDAQLEELRQLLPSMSDKRLRKIQRIFRHSLGDPPLLELILAVRENIPDYVTSAYLKKSSALTAKFVLQKAAQDETVDTNLLNGVLSLQTSAGSLDSALDTHQTEFKARNLNPTSYSDRLVLQMFLKNNRLPRALAFKEKLKESGRPIDLKSYGSLIDYCSRRQQLGSALLLLKECISVHGAHPEEATLRQLRLLCRQNNLTDAVGLTDMIGKDPLEWLRHGEKYLKREMSKKGRKDVQLAQNQAVRL